MYSSPGAAQQRIAELKAEIARLQPIASNGAAAAAAALPGAGATVRLHTVTGQNFLALVEGDGTVLKRLPEEWQPPAPSGASGAAMVAPTTPAITDALAALNTAEENAGRAFVVGAIEGLQQILAA